MLAVDPLMPGLRRWLEVASGQLHHLAQFIEPERGHAAFQLNGDVVGADTGMSGDLADDLAQFAHGEPLVVPFEDGHLDGRVALARCARVAQESPSVADTGETKVEFVADVDPAVDDNGVG